MLLWMLAIGIGVLGLAAAMIGFRGRRVNDHPICRGCGFDLVGLAGRGGGEDQNEDAESTDLRAGQARDARCPECGRELSRRRAVRVGARRRRRVVLVAGLLLFAGGAAWTGALVWGRAQSFDWNTVKPTWLLMIQTRQPGADNADAGMQELVKRLEAGSLDAGQIGTIAQRILEAQGNPDLPWHGSWGRFVEVTHGRGELDEQQLARYVRQALDGAVGPYPMSYRNGSVRWGLQVQNMRGSSGAGRGTFKARVQIESLEIGDRTIDTQIRSLPNLRTLSSLTATRLEQVDLPAGEFDVVLRGQVEVGEDEAMLSEDGTVIARWPITLQTMLDVEEENAITWIDDPGLRPVWQKDHMQTPTARAAEGGAVIHGFLHFESVPVGLVSDVFVRDGEREWNIGRLTLPAGYRGGAGLSPSETLEGFDAERVDIILRTVEDEQPDASWPAEVWRGEVIFEDVPLQWRGRGP